MSNKFTLNLLKWPRMIKLSPYGQKSVRFFENTALDFFTHLSDSKIVTGNTLKGLA